MVRYSIRGITVLRTYRHHSSDRFIILEDTPNSTDLFPILILTKGSPKEMDIMTFLATALRIYNSTGLSETLPIVTVLSKLPPA